MREEQKEWCCKTCSVIFLLFFPHSNQFEESLLTIKSLRLFLRLIFLLFRPHKAALESVVMYVYDMDLWYWVWYFVDNHHCLWILVFFFLF
jgi:hypothetical protein